MLSRETIIKRLAIAKYLYKLGYTQSQLPESMAFASLLSFHDAVEIFLKLAAENEDIKSDKFSFLQYWETIPKLTLKESMGNLNARRVNLKHKGILPAKLYLEISRVNTTDFFTQNTKIIFGIDFNEISLINLVDYPKVREYLELSQKAVEENKLPEAIEQVSFAFAELLYAYQINKTDSYKRSPFLFGEKVTWWPSTYEKLKSIDTDLARNIQRIKESVESMQDSVKIMSIGIDYRKYSMFKLLTPVVTRVGDTLHAELYGEKRWTNINITFCIEFVIETALKLQDFDFDIKHLIDDEPIEMEYVSGDLEKGIVFRKISKK